MRRAENDRPRRRLGGWSRPWVFLCLAFLTLLVLAAPASAVPGIPEDGVVQGGYRDPIGGSNPHGGYSTTTNKCKICHAVHGAADTGETLLRSAKIYVPSVPQAWDPWEENHSAPCVYCHVGGPFAITQVYDNDPNLYYMESVNLNYLNNHSSSHSLGSAGLPSSPSGTYEGCPSCHSVHGANTWDPDEGDSDPSTHILRNDPGPSMPAPVANMDDFCRDCHDMTGQNGANDPQTGGSCGGHCHRSWLYDPITANVWVRAIGIVTKSGAYNGQSHIMTSTLTNAQGQDRSVAASQNCRSCHSGGNHTPGNSWPHLTSGAAFLADDHTVPTQLDHVCLDCHDDGVQNGSFGVGDAF